MFDSIARCLRTAKATAKAVFEVSEIIDSKGWLDPTDEEYRFAVLQSVGGIKLPEEERQELLEALLERKDDIVRASYKRRK